MGPLCNTLYILPAAYHYTPPFLLLELPASNVKEL